MPKKILKSKYLLSALILFLMGTLFLGAGKLVSEGSQERELAKAYQEAAALYEKNDLTKAIAGFAKIALLTEDEKAAAVSLYNVGTIYLEEFLRNEEGTDHLKAAILYLQEALRKNSDFDRAQRNLELAWKKVKEKGLMDQIPYPGEGQDSQKDGSGAKDDGEGKTGELESEDTGNANTLRPFPDEGEEGFGRGEERKDY